MSRVLVVDDDRGIRELLRIALEAEGYAVSTLGDGRGVVAWLAEHREPCVALMDLSMPLMTGWEVCAAALGEHHLVILTAEPLSAAECPAPAVRLVAKPFNLDALLALVAGLFAQPAMSAAAHPPSVASTAAALR
jgi:CheY-like chemotaxis protein